MMYLPNSILKNPHDSQLLSNAVLRLCGHRYWAAMDPARAILSGSFNLTTTPEWVNS
jgi:hypothetical protein